MYKLYDLVRAYSRAVEVSSKACKDTALMWLGEGALEIFYQQNSKEPYSKRSFYVESYNASKSTSCAITPQILFNILVKACSALCTYIVNNIVDTFNVYLDFRQDSRIIVATLWNVYSDGKQWRIADIIFENDKYKVTAY